MAVHHGPCCPLVSSLGPRALAGSDAGPHGSWQVTRDHKPTPRGSRCAWPNQAPGSQILPCEEGGSPRSFDQGHLLTPDGVDYTTHELCVEGQNASSPFHTLRNKEEVAVLPPVRLDRPQPPGATSLPGPPASHRGEGPVGQAHLCGFSLSWCGPTSGWGPQRPEVNGIRRSPADRPYRASLQFRDKPRIGRRRFCWKKQKPAQVAAEAAGSVGECGRNRRCLGCSATRAPSRAPPHVQSSS